MAIVRTQLIRNGIQDLVYRYVARDLVLYRAHVPRKLEHALYLRCSSKYRYDRNSFRLSVLFFF